MITRDNWREHCQEPELIADEKQERHEMLEACRVQNGLIKYLAECTESENNAFPSRVSEWSELVIWADANRRLQRAELVAWRRWQEQHGELEQLELEL